MDVVNAILGILLFFSTPAAVVGGITAVIVRATGGRATRAFWIAFLITIAVELIVLGVCLATIDDIYGV